MRIKILLTGKDGQIGRELWQQLRPLGEVVALGREQLDLLKPSEIRQSIRTVRPNLIVNAAAYTAVDQAETDEAIAFAVNAGAPGVMAEEAKKLDAAIVHYSSDYVFRGSKTTPYVEDDPTGPVNAYGRTKRAGEEAVQSVGGAYLIFRTAWVYAQEGSNFLLTMLRLATQQEELKIVCDQIGAPTWSREIAKATAHILSRVYAREASVSLVEAGGIYHMTAAGETSRYDFARAILEEFPKFAARPAWLGAATNGRPLMARLVTPISADEYPTPARRPAYSALCNRRLGDVFGVQLPSWRAQLHSVFSEEPPEIG
jgi:dTDP-4-dehydrorhamnose reductase